MRFTNSFLERYLSIIFYVKEDGETCGEAITQWTQRNFFLLKTYGLKIRVANGLLTDK